jgi:hypothetical protein
MASEVTGLADLRGFLKLGNLVVRLSFPFVDLPTQAPALMERPYSAPDLAPPETPPIGTPAPDPFARVAAGTDSQRLATGQEQDHVFG